MNIKEIGKELMGKSLNSYHRKLGLTQLEENNKMQDGILNGILSQVDDAYIEKTEQSNVIHLDGSGDGVVVLDSIEGNTMVNEINSEVLRNWTYSHNTYTGQYANTQEFGIDWSKEVQFNCWLQARNDSNPIFSTLKPNTDYTVWINILENNPTLDGVPVTNSVGGLQLWINGYQSVRQSLPINTTGWVSFNYRWTREDNSINYSIFGLSISGTNSDGTKTINGGKLRISKEVIVLEGVDKPLDSYFEGLQSSFEEKVNDEGKYEIEILSNNGNIFDINAPIEPYIGSSCKVENESITVSCDSLGWYRSTMTLNGLKPNTTYYLKYEYESISGSPYKDVNIHDANGYKEGSNANALPLTNGTFTTPNGCRSIKIRFYCGSNTTFGTIKYKNIMISENDMNYIPRKHNKIKLLLNSPLLKGDKLVIKDGKLCHYHKSNLIQVSIENNFTISNTSSSNGVYIQIPNNKLEKPFIYDPNNIICNKFKTVDNSGLHSFNYAPCIGVTTDNYIRFIIKYETMNMENYDFNKISQWLMENPIMFMYKLAEPYYEEITNEYGEPIILEGYENGTLYIDSTIIPTTTVRYTPKMESFKTLKEVENNNIILTNDVNDNIIPYMMDVDLMIMEKEMALMSHKNIRKMEVLDMTSMQKRTQDMLERLIKGKTLTEQECKTRVTTYLHAGKITDEQAEELMLLVSEVYA